MKRGHLLTGKRAFLTKEKGHHLDLNRGNYQRENGHLSGMVRGAYIKSVKRAPFRKEKGELICSKRGAFSYVKRGTYRVLEKPSAPGAMPSTLRPWQ